MNDHYSDDTCTLVRKNYSKMIKNFPKGAVTSTVHFDLPDTETHLYGDIFDTATSTDKLNYKDTHLVSSDGVILEKWYYDDTYVISCKDAEALSPYTILKSVNLIKARMEERCSSYIVESVECEMTPKIRENISMAYKRAKSFGKENRILIARFDEFGNRLPDEMNLGIGPRLFHVSVNIVEPENEKEYYFCMKVKVGNVL